MSNSKRYSEGNKGSDLSYRGKVLKGLQNVSDNTQALQGLSALIIDAAELTVVKAPTSFASTGVTNVPVGATEVSIFNNGTGDATVNGVKCPPGVTRNFGMRNPISAVIVCNGGGTEELIIDYML